MPIIAQTKTVHRYGETPLPQYTADQPSRWTAASGVLLTSEAPRTLYNGTDYRTIIYLEPSNETRAVGVTATNASAQSGQVTTQIEATLPGTYSFGYEFSEEEQADISYADDKRYRKVRYHGLWLQKWRITWDRRQTTNYTEVRNFRRHHRLHLPFWINDSQLGELQRVTFDSGLKGVPRHHNLKDFSVVVVSAPPN